MRVDLDQPVSGISPSVCDFLNKGSRAVERQKRLQRKRLDYMRWVQHTQDMSSSSSSDNRAKAHRSVRALTRTCLAHGFMETCSDVPGVSQGKAGRWKRWARKPSVWPLLRGPAPAVKKGRCRQGEAALQAWEDILAEFSAKADSDVMETHISPAEVDILAENCCRSAPGQKLFGSLEEAVDAMRASGPEGVELQAKGVLSLEQLINDDAMCAARSLKLDAPEVLLHMLKDHPSLAVQKACCACIAAIVASGNDGRTCVGALGGIQALVSAMHRYANSVDLQESCCRGLKELAAQHATNCQSLLQVSGLDAVVEAMRLHPASAQLQVAACGVIRNTSSGSSKCQSQLASLGAMQRVMCAVAWHSKDVRVQCAGIWALFCLVLQNRALQGEAVAQGAIHAVLSAMKAQTSVRAVQEAGCYALRELASAVVTDVSLWSDMAQAVSRAMRDHSDPALQKAGHAVRQRLFARGLRRMSTPATQLVKPSIVKRRRLATPSLPVILE
eukprot:TRINITY_DN20505_c0_g1_i1.p1 TRINITY_DN20505_c0_g1~~TRINITY_DN20505_c0_g1_i1.p1  ORF type:complete len:501 (+),score=77.56 TRINITY_DN20505_c0_g1_i1:76-1578(+)